MDSIVNLLVISVYFGVRDLILKLFFGRKYCVFMGFVLGFLEFLRTLSSELITKVCIKMIVIFTFILICYSCSKS